MVRIRLRRGGRKKAPVYRIVVADSKSPRDGKFIEIIGQYAPRQDKGQGGLTVDAERALYWMGVGAQPSDTVRSLLRKAGVMKQKHERMLQRKQGIMAATAVPVREDAAAEAGTTEGTTAEG